MDPSLLGDYQGERSRGHREDVYFALAGARWLSRVLLPTSSARERTGIFQTVKLYPVPLNSPRLLADLRVKPSVFTVASRDLTPTLLLTATPLPLPTAMPSSPTVFYDFIKCQTHDRSRLLPLEFPLPGTPFPLHLPMTGSSLAWLSLSRASGLGSHLTSSERSLLKSLAHTAPFMVITSLFLDFVGF